MTPEPNARYFQARPVRTILTALLSLTLCIAANADKHALASPNKRYLIRLHHKRDSIYPVIILRDTRTGREVEVFDYDSTGQGTTALEALWSPDSRHVALDISVGPSTHEVAVYRIEDGKATEAELLPLPKALDIKKYSFRGGTFASHWKDNRTLWIGDNSKNRSFRYRFTENGKLLTDAFKDDLPN